MLIVFDSFQIIILNKQFDKNYKLKRGITKKYYFQNNVPCLTIAPMSWQASIQSFMLISLMVFKLTYLISNFEKKSQLTRG